MSPAPADGPAQRSAPPRARRRRSRLLLATALAALLLACLELVVRISGITLASPMPMTPHQVAFTAAHMFATVDDPALAYTNTPSARVQVDDIVYRHDEHGRRVGGGPCDEAPPPARTPGGALPPGGAPDGVSPGAPEVVFLGDSTTYGLGVRVSEALPALVASSLGGSIRALNLGVCGYATAQETALYLAQRQSFPGCRLVVLVMFPNDFTRGTWFWDDELVTLHADPLPLPFACKRVLWRSALYRALSTAVVRHTDAARTFDPLEPSNLPGVIADLERLDAIVRADGRQLVVAEMPAMERLDPYAVTEQVAAIGRTCARLGTAFVDLLPAFLAERERVVAEFERRTGKAVPEEQRARFLARYWVSDPLDHHLNAAGNRVAALALAPVLAPLLDRGATR